MPATKGSAGKGAVGKRGATSRNGGHRLVIVESPAKARTIAGYLGTGYVVESSIGHIRDMPDKAAEIPAKYRKESWARLGVNVDEGFEALYVVPADKKPQVTKLRHLLADADELLLATDEDREGEAIAWHLLEELRPKVPARRMVFHEITPEAIAEAVANPRDLDHGLVDAYQTRREPDPLYWDKVTPARCEKGLSRALAWRGPLVASRAGWVGRSSPNSVWSRFYRRGVSVGPAYARLEPTHGHVDAACGPSEEPTVSALSDARHILHFRSQSSERLRGRSLWSHQSSREMARVCSDGARR